MSEYAHPEVLISTDDAKAKLGQSGIKFVEVDVDTQAYDAGHLPGAVGFNWQTQLQDQVNRDIPTKQEFERLMSEAGVSNRLSNPLLVLWSEPHQFLDLSRPQGRRVPPG